jgi:prevent-host-death family protein
VKTLTITESKTRLSALVEQVATTGRPVLIGRAGKPMVQIVPWQPVKAGRRLGAFRGKIKLAPDYATWPKEEARALGLDD